MLVNFLVLALLFQSNLLQSLMLQHSPISSGLIAVFKPKGWSSSAVVLKLRWILSNGYKEETGRKVKIKVGHGGTLDPLAEGVLVIGVGHGTKLMDSYLVGAKRYQTIGKLGYETDTLDCTGNITETVDCGHITSYEMMNEKLDQFRGDIEQVPPMYSALKKDGKKYYELAREGVEIERKSRAVSVYELNLMSHYYGSSSTDITNSQGNSTTSKSAFTAVAAAIANDTHHVANMLIQLPYFGLNICSSGGFYVRSLISDVGRSCNTRAHMTDLLRSQHGDFELKHCLYEKDWNYQSICQHIITSSKLVGVKVEDLPQAVLPPIPEPPSKTATSSVTVTASAIRPTTAKISTSSSTVPEDSMHNNKKVKPN